MIRPQQWDESTAASVAALGGGGYVGGRLIEPLRDRARQFFHENYDIEGPAGKQQARMVSNEAKRKGYSFDVAPNAVRPHKERVVRHPTDPRGLVVQLSRRSPMSVIAHEVGHVKTRRDMQRIGLGTPYAAGKGMLRHWLKIPVSGAAALSAGTYAATGNDYLAAAAPLLPASLALADETAASARGLNLIRQVRPEFRKGWEGLMKLFQRHGRLPLSALGTYAARGLPVGAGMLGAVALKNLLSSKKQEG